MPDLKPQISKIEVPILKSEQSTKPDNSSGPTQQDNSV